MKVLNNNSENIEFITEDDCIVISAADVPQKSDYVDIIDESLFAHTGDNGYYVIADADRKGSRLCKFTQKDDGERVYEQVLMPIFGVKNNNGCMLFIAEKSAALLNIVFGVKDGEYYIYPRFVFGGSKPYEDIKIRMICLSDNADYSDMAVAYREYKLKNGDCEPLSEKIKKRDALDYALSAPEIRIRMGWKPAPPIILEQTPENEPEMFVACTFKQVEMFIDELKACGIEKAEICLVGWNKSGHDGRYPQLFPVEEKLGGEEGLKSLISHAKESGYKIVCHTNSTDCYSIADRFSDDIISRKANGSKDVNDMGWSGGRMYNLCPKAAEEFAKEDLPKVAKLGFEGLHYIDVMSVIPLRWCHSNEHESNPNETLEHYNNIMNMCHKLFGGFASEGVFDFAAKYLDYGLYVSWPPVDDDMLDEIIPLWNIVYHGIILSNPTTDTVNFSIKDKKNLLTVAEYGARPSFYIYSKFMSGGSQDDWLGVEDLTIGTPETMHFAARKIKEGCDSVKDITALQTEFITKHEITENNIHKVSYSSGRQVIVDYLNETFKVID